MFERDLSYDRTMLAISSLHTCYLLTFTNDTKAYCLVLAIFAIFFTWPTFLFVGTEVAPAASAASFPATPALAEPNGLLRQCFRRVHITL